MQPPSRIAVAPAGQALLLRRVESRPLARAAAAMAEVLEAGEARGLITAAQHAALAEDLAQKMQPLLQSG